MTQTKAKRGAFRLLNLAVPAVCMVSGGCVGLPGPDGFEAAIIKQAEGLPPLAPVKSHDVKGVARNGLLLSPAVREAASLVSASADEVRVQRAALFPGLSLSAGSGLGSAGRGDSALELTGSQLLFDGGNSRRAVEVADFDLQISYIAFQKSVDDAAVEVLEAYDSVQKQQELLAIYRKQLAALTELESLVTARTESGAVSTSDLLEARKRVQSAAFLVNDAELALGEARDRLTLLGGQPEGGRLQIAAASCQSRNDSDSIRIAKLELARAQIALEKADRAARMPKVLLKPIVGGEIGVNKLPVGVNLDIQSDLLQGGALTARANVARNNLSAAEAQLGVVQLEDEVSERALLRSLDAGGKREAMLKRQIALLSKTRDLYRSQYFDMGTRQLSELLDNEEEYYTRQAELIELRSTLAANHLECAVRSRALRRDLGLADFSIYGFPLQEI